MLTVLVIRRTEVVLKKGFGVEYTVAKNTTVEQGGQLCESMNTLLAIYCQ